MMLDFGPCSLQNDAERHLLLRTIVVFMDWEIVTSWSWVTRLLTNRYEHTWVEAVWSRKEPVAKDSSQHCPLITVCSVRHPHDDGQSTQFETSRIILTTGSLHLRRDYYTWCYAINWCHYQNRKKKKKKTLFTRSYFYFYMKIGFTGNCENKICFLKKIFPKDLGFVQL